MRLWSVHPRYLDTAGLTACWREALLAQKVLAGLTRGYRHHPQLERFLPGSALGSSAGAGALAVGGSGASGSGASGSGASGSGAVGAMSAGGWPGDLVVAYLRAVADEADARGFRYDRTRIVGPAPARTAVGPIEVTDGQVAYEWTFLRAKLAARSPAVLDRWSDVVVPDVHPLFVVVPGPVAPWEVVQA